MTGQRPVTSGWRATSAMRASAPRRRPSGLSSTRSQPRTPLMSIRALGRITSSFIRSRIIVPPTMNWASADVGGPNIRPAFPRQELGRASPRRPRADRRKAASGPPHLGPRVPDCRDDVGIGGAAAEIAAHMFANVRIALRVTFLDAADRRHDLARRAVAALKGGGPVKAMLIQNTNSMVVAPGQETVRRGFSRADLIRLRARAVHDRHRALCRRRAARDDVPRARRHLHRQRAPVSRSRQRRSIRLKSAGRTTT